MRDITKDIGERLTEIECEEARLRKRLERLSEHTRVLTQLLGEEKLRWLAEQATLTGFDKPLTAQKKLGPFLIEVLSDGDPHTTAELTTLVEREGLIAEGKAPRRAVQFALAGMKHHRKVKMDQSGVWLIDRQNGNDGR